ncbi:hypothetical protein SUDANB37_00023 [Streptomyces sp. enrichment culture]
MGFPAPGRRVLVSGASRGLGRAVAEAFAAHGDRVAVHFSSREQEARRTYEGLAGTGHVRIGQDLADPAGAVRLAEAAADALGGIDVLVNNAAVNSPHPLPGTSYEEWVAAWERHVSVNLLATAHLSHLAARRTIRRTGRRRRLTTPSASLSRCRSRHTASLSRRSLQASSRRNGWRLASRVWRAKRSGRRAPSAGSPNQPRSALFTCSGSGSTSVDLLRSVTGDGPGGVRR